MKSQFILIALAVLILLPSCVISRSRYGNGIHIEMPEVFQKDRTQANAKTRHRHPATAHHITNSKDSSKMVTSEHLNTTLNVNTADSNTEKKVAQTVKTTLNKIVRKPVAHIKTVVKYQADETPKKQQKPFNYKSNHSSTPQKQNRVSADNDYFGWLFKLLGQIILAAIVGTLIVGIIVILLPPDVLFWFIIIINVIYYISLLFT